MNLTNAIDGAHDKLIKMPAKKQARLEAERDKHDVPNKFSALLTNLQVLAHFVDCVCADLLHSAEKLSKLKQCLLLSFLIRVVTVHDLCHRLTLARLGCNLCFFLFFLLILFDALNNVLQLLDNHSVFLPN